jgi:hypothetical protein
MASISEFFRGACMGNFAEANNGEVALVDEDADEVLELLQCVVLRDNNWLKPITGQFFKLRFPKVANILRKIGYEKINFLTEIILKKKFLQKKFSSTFSNKILFFRLEKPTDVFERNFFVFSTFYFSVTNFPILIRYARKWLMPGVLVLGERFVETKLAKIKPDLYTTIEMLVGASLAQ